MTENGNSYTDIIDLMLDENGGIRFEGTMILDFHESLQLMDPVKLPENPINVNTKNINRNKLFMYGDMTFSENFIRVDERPKDGILYDDCACRIWHENMWHIKAKLGEKYDNRFLIEQRDDPQFTLRKNREGVIELVELHVRVDIQGLTCPICNTNYTSKHEYGGLEYYPGWICHECGYHGASESEWEDEIAP